ncbi:unnamed protein product [Mesocestoides corti]|nr:unnamed protein product [Mesocestoides corti]
MDEISKSNEVTFAATDQKIELEKLIQMLLLSSDVSSNLSSDPQLVDCVSRLSVLRLDELAAIPKRIEAEEDRIRHKTEQLAVENYPIFLANANTSREVHREFISISSSNENLLANIGAVSCAAQKMFDNIGRNANAFRVAAKSVQNYAQILEFLELPQFMETCVQNGYYQDALNILNHTKQMTKKYGQTIPIVRIVGLQTQEISGQLFSQLCKQLREPITLPICLKAVIYLRQLEVFTEQELRLNFLQARSICIHEQLEVALAKPIGISNFGSSAKVPHLVGYQKAEYVAFIRAMRRIEVTRVHLFDSITQYRAIFADEETYSAHSTDPHQQPVFADMSPLYQDELPRPLRYLSANRVNGLTPANETSLFHAWLVRQVDIFLDGLIDDLTSLLHLPLLTPSEVSDRFQLAMSNDLITTEDVDVSIAFQQVHSVMTQALYFGRSFARIGCDFRPHLGAVFSRAILTYFETLMANALTELNVFLELWPWELDSSFTMQSDEISRGEVEAPSAIARYPILAFFCNRLLTSLNGLRVCCPIGLKQGVLSACTRTLHDAAESIIAAHKSRQLDTTKARKQSVHLASVFAHVLTPHLLTCLLEHVFRGDSEAHLWQLHFENPPSTAQTISQLKKQICASLFVVWGQLAYGPCQEDDGEEVEVSQPISSSGTKLSVDAPRLDELGRNHEKPTLQVTSSDSVSSTPKDVESVSEVLPVIATEVERKVPGTKTSVEGLQSNSEDEEPETMAPLTMKSDPSPEKGDLERNLSEYASVSSTDSKHERLADDLQIAPTEDQSVDGVQLRHDTTKDSLEFSPLPTQFIPIQTEESKAHDSSPSTAVDTTPPPLVSIGQGEPSPIVDIAEPSDSTSLAMNPIADSVVSTDAYEVARQFFKQAPITEPVKGLTEQFGEEVCGDGGIGEETVHQGFAEPQPILLNEGNAVAASKQSHSDVGISPVKAGVLNAMTSLQHDPMSSKSQPGRPHSRDIDNLKSEQVVGEAETEEHFHSSTVFDSLEPNEGDPSEQQALPFAQETEHQAMECVRLISDVAALTNDDSRVEASTDPSPHADPFIPELSTLLENNGSDRVVQVTRFADPFAPVIPDDQVEVGSDEHEFRIQVTRDESASFQTTDLGKEEASYGTPETKIADTEAPFDVVNSTDKPKTDDFEPFLSEPKLAPQVSAVIETFPSEVVCGNAGALIEKETSEHPHVTNDLVEKDHPAIKPPSSADSIQEGLSTKPPQLLSTDAESDVNSETPSIEHSKPESADVRHHEYDHDMPENECGMYNTVSQPSTQHSLSVDVHEVADPPSALNQPEIDEANQSNACDASSYANTSAVQPESDFRGSLRDSTEGEIWSSDRTWNADVEVEVLMPSQMDDQESEPTVVESTPLSREVVGEFDVSEKPQPSLADECRLESGSPVLEAPPCDNAKDVSPLNEAPVSVNPRAREEEEVLPPADISDVDALFRDSDYTTPSGDNERRPVHTVDIRECDSMLNVEKSSTAVCCGEDGDLWAGSVDNTGRSASSEPSKMQYSGDSESLVVREPAGRRLEGNTNDCFVSENCGSVKLTADQESNSGTVLSPETPQCVADRKTLIPSGEITSEIPFCENENEDGTGWDNEDVAWSEAGDQSDFLAHSQPEEKRFSGVDAPEQKHPDTVKVDTQKCFPDEQWEDDEPETAKHVELAQAIDSAVVYGQPTIPGAESPEIGNDPSAMWSWNPETTWGEDENAWTDGAVDNAEQPDLSPRCNIENAATESKRDQSESSLGDERSLNVGKDQSSEHRVDPSSSSLALSSPESAGGARYEVSAAPDIPASDEAANITLCATEASVSASDANPTDLEAPPSPISKLRFDESVVAESESADWGEDWPADDDAVASALDLPPTLNFDGSVEAARSSSLPVEAVGADSNAHQDASTATPSCPEDAKTLATDLTDAAGGEAWDVDF